MRGLILFDIDGTLLRAGDKAHQAALVDAMREVFEFPVDLDGVPLAGMLDSQIARLALQKHKVPVEEINSGLEQVMLAMERRYRELLDGDSRHGWVLPGVVELSERLADEYLLAVMTGNASGVARAKLDAAGLSSHFHFGSFGDSADERHELVDVAIDLASEHHAVQVERHMTMIVGDTPRDIEAARLAGVRVAAVATGRFSVADLEPHVPDLLFPDLGDVEMVHRRIDEVLNEA